jgi:Na+-translocating ferredoxin:NAD+ oxidoreductase RnfC subunit
METEQFEAVLTGTDTPVNGIVTKLNNSVYEFRSLDESLQITISRDTNGRWTRIAGSEPYLSGWVDELAEQIQTSINY